MKTVKRRYELFQFYNSDGIEAHLTKMAERGWQLEKINPFYWQYQKIEPQSLRYTVTYFSEASEFDSHLPANQEVFYDYCANAGWNFITQWAQMQIFCSAKRDPIAIATDEEIKLQAIHKAMKKNFLPGSFALIALALVQIFIRLYTLIDNPIYLLSNSMALSSALAWNILAIAFVIQLGGYFSWYKGSQKSIAQGGDCLRNAVLGSRVSFLILVLMFLALAMIMANVFSKQTSWVFFVGFLLITFASLVVIGIKKSLKRAGVSRKRSIAVTLLSCLALSFVFTLAFSWVIFRGLDIGLLGDQPVEQKRVTFADGNTWTWDIHLDSLPLKVEDLQNVDYEYYSYQLQVQSSFLVAQYTASQRALPDKKTTPTLEYEIVDVKWPILYHICLNDYLQPNSWEKERPESERRVYRQIDDKNWQADAVYQIYVQNKPQSKYLICWGNRIVEIQFDEIPTPEQIAIAAEKLKQPSQLW